MYEEEIFINYWKESKSEIKEIAIGINDIMLLIHNSIEFENLINFLNMLPYSNPIVYISLTKSYESLKMSYDKIQTNVFTVDCVSKGLFNKADTHDCMYDFAPSHLFELVDLIQKVFEKKMPKYLIIDSLSQYIDFSLSQPDQESIFLFSKHLKDICSQYGCKFIILYDDVLGRPLKNLPTLYIDKVIKIEVIKEKIFIPDYS